MNHKISVLDIKIDTSLEIDDIIQEAIEDVNNYLPLQSKITLSDYEHGRYIYLLYTDFNMGEYQNKLNEFYVKGLFSGYLLAKKIDIL
jgi:hypothetical protein